ncbi:DNA starvation/stationary phase protection protein Dps [Rhodobacteraceae bacterium CCMM004]|nr:DNA starvation/stationary phase protection protein Dps [Rhodobacteraceae bacterium CCMM004]
MHPTRNTLPNNTRKVSISLLQNRLHDAIDLTAQAKQAHWNVKGPSFIALHELFDTIHGELDSHADLIAERLVSLGGQAHGTVRAAAAGSSLEEYPLKASTQEDHIAALSSALAKFGESVRIAIDETANCGDQDTSDLFTEISRAIDKSLWFVEAHQS